MYGTYLSLTYGFTIVNEDNVKEKKMTKHSKQNKDV